ncbi:MAG: CPBP family intramembrane glutamic endopeptidase [Actinomycetota bacterium]
MNSSNSATMKAPSEAPWLAIICATAWTASAILSRTIGMWSGVGGAAVLLGLLVLVLERGESPARLRARGLDILVGILSGGVMIGATYVLYPVVRHLVPTVVPQAVELYATFGAAKGPGSIALLGLVVLGEELVWRGAVQDGMTARFGPVVGVLATTLLYGLAVLPVGLPLLVGIALGFGLFWSVLREVTRSLTAPLIAHLLWNLVVLVLHPITGAA